MLCGFWALGHLPMAQAVALSYATPLFATVAAVFILGETVRLRRWTAVVIGLVGVLVIVRPGSTEFSLGTLVALSGADAAPAVSFCNTGHWASTNWFVMSEIAGNKAVKLYPASVVEWSQAERPMQNQPSRVTALVQDVKRAFDK